MRFTLDQTGPDANNEYYAIANIYSTVSLCRIITKSLDYCGFNANFIDIYLIIFLDSAKKVRHTSYSKLFNAMARHFDAVFSESKQTCVRVSTMT